MILGCALLDDHCVVSIMIHVGLRTIHVLTQCRHQDGDGNCWTLLHCSFVHHCICFHLFVTFYRTSSCHRESHDLEKERELWQNILQTQGFKETFLQKESPCLRWRVRSKYKVWIGAHVFHNWLDKLQIVRSNDAQNARFACLILSIQGRGFYFCHPLFDK